MAKIVGVQFSILSPDEIRNGSVAAITSRDTYINGKPVINGLFDPRMGVLEPGYVCPTDGLDYINTPGYFGHINLAKPVFYVQYLSTVIKILRCTCFKCSKLLINKDTFKHALQMNPEQRWNFVFALASKVKRCGDETCDGCGCKQPTKIRKEGLATLTAVWDKMDLDAGDEISMVITPEIVVKQFRRISDEDCAFMGFSPVWSRPDWMVCQVLAVPPPAVRPSVKHDSQQRSEDDISHIIVNIIKANKMLQDKMDSDANENIINDWHLLLQYHISTMVDNNIPGVAVAAQRSGRPLKSIKERLNGKGGRIRGNLMGKRVDFSARSVITPDPNLSITELGVPKKIAMNITSPVCVNERNITFLTTLIQNGPDEYPGAKTLIRKNGDNISLRYVDRKSIHLKHGDVVHRHMMDGDPVLFNRQPTLHRMSMMCHRARIMPRGDTFRLNVACTKPYNADFDGDEMNMHMPQSIRSASELMNLAAVPWQMISPANNKPIIGIFQDSLLGVHLLTRPNVQFTPRDAMNLLMAFDKVDISKLNDSTKNSFDVLSQIMPPLSLKYKTKQFGDTEDFATSNNVLDIQNGLFVRGQIEKSVLGDGTKGLLKRITSDFGHSSASHFIDNLQNIVTEYMKTTSYSVGISDLIADASTNETITDTITSKKQEVRSLIDQTHLGIFENNTSRTDEEEFETKINNILNRASNEAGKIGRQSLNKDNRFVIMVNAGSKGSELNISQMISCLGQQNVDGKRIPYGFENRTLPHFNKFDDSPAARGFVESSFISGLSPTELFFHAMGGRVGLIDTAVKTSQTGYIQRRLIKGLEDLKTEYDMTVRNNKGRIIQFAYGDDGIDTTYVESQVFPLVSMSINETYDHFYVSTDKAPYTKDAMERMAKQKDTLAAKTKSIIDEMNAQRIMILEKVFGMRDNSKVHVPVAFKFIIDNVQGQQFININSLVDITPVEAYEMIEAGLDRLRTLYYAPPSKLFETIYRFHLAPAILLNQKRFHRKALSVLIERIIYQYKKSVVAPGEMVGLVAAQSIGEPTTQMSLHADERIRLMKRTRGTELCEAVTVTIGEFCDSIISENPNLTMNTGHPDSVETVIDGDEYFVVGVDGSEKTKWNLISHVSRHPVNGDMMKVTTRSGRIVRTTTSHSHLIRRNQTVEPITGSDMKPGMRIPVCKRIETPFECATVDIGGVVYPLDERLGWFVGAYLAEGSINYHTFGISNISEHFREQTRATAALFDKSCKYKEQDGEYGRSGTTSFTHKELAIFIRNTCGVGSHNKRVPGFAFTAPKSFKSALVQGYFDGDRNIQVDANHHQFRASSRSDQLIKDMSQLLTEFGIFATMKRDNKNMFNLNISVKYARMYKDNIDSIIHSGKLNEMVSYEERKQEHARPETIEKVSGLGDIIAHCGKVLQLPGQSRTYSRWTKKDTIGVRTLQKYIYEFQNHPESYRIKEELAVLNQAANADIVWDEVVDIEIYCADQSEYVYDFTVPATQTFMVDNGVIVHNTLNTFHFAGVASKSNVTRGVPRIEEILSLSDNPKNPSCTVYLHRSEERSLENAEKAKHMLERTCLKDVVDSVQICFDPDNGSTNQTADAEMLRDFHDFEKMVDGCLEQEDPETDGKSKWVIRIEMSIENMLDRNLTMDDINFAIKNTYQDEVECAYSDYNDDSLIFRIRMTSVLGRKKIPAPHPLDQSDEIFLLKKFQEKLLNDMILRGVKDIGRVTPRKVTDSLYEEDGKYVKQESWVLDTIGTNLIDILGLEEVDSTRTFTNDIQEIHRTLGIEAARQAIFNEISEVIEFDSTYINYHHLSVLCDRMTSKDKMVSIFRHGINNDDIGPIAKASFEETPEMFLKAARHGELDSMRGVSANVMCGQKGYFGTSAFQVMLDLDKRADMTTKKWTAKEHVEDAFEKMAEGIQGPCADIAIQSNVQHTRVQDIGEADNGYQLDF